jgi:DivIVA domain-containing protein
MATDRPRLGPGESSLSPDLIAQRGFSSARRGFDPDEVKAFLAVVADELRGLRQREAGLERARREAEDRAAHPTLDENTLMAAVGEETASILRSAHTAAHDIRTKAEDNASRILKEAHDRTAALLEEAETVLARRTAEAEAVAARITEVATNDAERLRNSGRQEAEALLGQTEAERKLIIEAAHGARERILNDLNRRRNVAVVQIEQLRAGRERLLEAYKIVRRTLDEVTGELQRADAEARAAADAAGRRPPPPETAEPGPAPVGSEAGATPSAPVAVASDLAAPVPQPSPAAGEGSDRGPRPGSEPANPANPANPGTTANPGNPAGPAETADSVGPVAGARTEVVEARRLTPLRVLRRQKEAKEGVERPGEPPRPVNGEGPSGPAAAVDHGPSMAVPNAPAGESEGGSVDDLFARIRADATQSDGAESTESAVADPAESAIADPAASAQADRAESERIPNEDEALLQRRDAAVGPIEASLARKLKRALQDEQNDLLDRLRGLRTKPTAATVLPAVNAHAERFSLAGRPLLDQAAKAGAAFAASVSGQAPPRKDAKTPDLDDLASDLAAAVVDPLRRRLEQAFAEGDDDDPGVLVESLGAAYREWKTERIEQTAADHVAGAFARGAFSATPEGTRLRWLVEDVNGPCPDCDDNALAGGLPKGEAFPTGQRWPPAHAGCRCLLVPEPGP